MGGFPLPSCHLSFIIKLYLTNILIFLIYLRETFENNLSLGSIGEGEASERCPTGNTNYLGEDELMLTSVWVKLKNNLVLKCRESIYKY